MGLADVARKLFDSRTKLDPADLKKAKPVRNEAIEVEELPDGSLLLTGTLSEQTRGLAGALAKRAKVPDIKQFELEPIGAFVWNLCDGRHSFEAISRKLRERYKMNRLEADAALVAFLQMLSQRRLITMLVAKSK